MPDVVMCSSFAAVRHAQTLPARSCFSKLEKFGTVGDWWCSNSSRRSLLGLLSSRSRDRPSTRWSNRCGYDVGMTGTRDAGVVVGLRSLDYGLTYPIPLRSGRWSVGRSSESDIAIDGAAVSSRHCLIERRHDDSVLVTDAGSTNGTRVNGAVITAATRLMAGFRLRLGDAEFVVVGDHNVASGSGIKREGGPTGTRRLRNQAKTLDELWRYVTAELEHDLLELPDLTGRERRFQHHIVSAVESSIEGASFAVDENATLATLNKRPDVLITHLRDDRHIAFEIKPNGTLEGLLEDAEKLRLYVDRVRTRVGFGVLVYRSPKETPHQLVRAMKRHNLHLIRVWHRS